MSEQQGSDHDGALEYSSKGNTRWIVVRGRWGRRLDRFVCHHTGYSLITKQYSKAAGRPYQPTLLLTTIGRRSGHRHTRALPYYELPLDDGAQAWVVIGSNGGGPKDPDWVWNIRSDDTAWVREHRREHAVRAHVAAGDERARLAEMIHARRDSLAHYEQRASTFGREVPLVVLRPR